MTTARVVLWGKTIGAVTWEEAQGIALFEYDRAFQSAGIEVSPLALPVEPGIFRFPALSQDSFNGLPGMLADSLPDKFGNAVIDAWLAREGRPRGAMNSVERLCYTGSRGMGALEYQPEAGMRKEPGDKLSISTLVDLAQDVIEEREGLYGELNESKEGKAALRDILRVGTSAGGARAKAVLAWNPSTGEFRSGQVEVVKGFQHWLMKFDGVSGNKDKELADPMGFGRLEYACYLMAKDAGVEMSECQLYEEGGRAHFMTKRFDRMGQGQKVHMQSLCAMRHFDFNTAHAYSYEQAIETGRLLQLPRKDLEQQVRRAYFNVIIRNQDDHTKNIAYLMDRSGKWTLSPAFDVVYAYNPSGSWTSQHQMSINGKATNFSEDDLIALASYADIGKRRAQKMLAEIRDVVMSWEHYAEQAGVSDDHAKRVKNGFRLRLK